MSRYELLWPDHPFVFRVPDGTSTRPLAHVFSDRIELLTTQEGEGRGRFRQTVFDLLSDIDDDEWVYWCIDDKYPIALDLDVHRNIVNGLHKLHSFDAVQLCRISPRPNSHQLQEEAPLHVGEYSFQRRNTYHRIWVHQFTRAKVLRTLFGAFPEVLASAKEMDYLKDELSPPADQYLYVSKTSYAVFGESTTRGMLTANCARSLMQGPGLPVGFEVSSSTRIMGLTDQRHRSATRFNRDRIRQLLSGLARRLRSVHCN